MPAKVKDEAKEKALAAFVDDVRLRGGITCRMAIVDDDRKEFFRGKDLHRYCMEHPGKLEGLVKSGVLSKSCADAAIEDQVKELVTLMLGSRTVVACDRFYKRPHPGRKHLVKFPRKLLPFSRNEQTWKPEAFYCFVEDRPMPPWQYAMAILMAVGIMCLCLFPLAPGWLRSLVVYFFLGLIGAIFGLIIVRFFIFLLIFAFIGYEFWLFPNLLSDQVDLIGAFKPLYSFEKPADGKSHLGTRIFGFCGVAFMLYVFYVYTPDEKSIRGGMESTSDIFGMLKNGPQASIGPGDYVQPKFGSDRTMDIDKIRQNILLEKQRKREEAQRRKAEGLTEEEEPDVVIPSLSEVYEEEAQEEAADAEQHVKEGANSAEADAAQNANAGSPSPQNDGAAENSEL